MVGRQVCGRDGVESWCLLCAALSGCDSGKAQRDDVLKVVQKDFFESHYQVSEDAE